MLRPDWPVRAAPGVTLAAALCAIPLLGAGWSRHAVAQPHGGPPMVGVVKAEPVPITESDEFVGRVQAVDRVALVARVTAFLEQRLFREGSEVKKGELLYVLEQPPFEADLQAKQAAVAQANALLQNATITFDRAHSLLSTPAGQRSTVDDAQAQQRSQAAQLLAAQAALTQSQINYSYTEIRSPIDGKISSTIVTIGNVVSPSTGTLATIVSQDPMYVLFTVSTREVLELRRRYAGNGGYKAIVAKLRLETGDMYGQDGTVDYTSPTVSTSTDTLTLRAVFPNPPRPGFVAGQTGSRELYDGEFVTVLVQGVAPITVLGVPRAAVLADQSGDYVYTLGSDNTVVRTPVTLGQNTAATAAVVHGLQDGELVISEGLQRVRPGMQVTPGPASTPPALPMTVMSGDAGSAATATATATATPGATSPGATSSGATSSGATSSGANAPAASANASSGNGITPAPSTQPAGH